MDGVGEAGDVQPVIAREVELLDPATRGLLPELDVPLHLGFGASGRQWGRQETIAALPADRRQVGEPAAVTSEMTGVQVGENAVLLTYVCQRGSSRSRRSSLWLRTETGWRIRFYQGTPIPPSD